MKILVCGHGLVVDSNRKIWSSIPGLDKNCTVDLMAPAYWKSNLIKNLYFNKVEGIDNKFNKIFKMNCFFKGSGSFYFFDPLNLYKILKNNDYDVIVLTQETWSLSLFIFTILRLLGLNKKAKFYIWVCQNIKKQQLYFLRYLERFNCKRLAGILCCCSEAVEVIRWKGIKTPCLYFPFSYDESQYDRKPLRYENKRIRLGYMGRLAKEKGILLLLETFNKLLAKGVDATLTIAGDGELRPLLEGKRGVHYLGLLKHREAYKFYDNIDLFVLASETTDFWKEQFGRVIIESVASGRPVLGSDSGAIPEVLANIEMPFVFKEKDEQDLMEKILEVKRMYDDSQMNSIMNNSASKNEKLYSQVSVARRFLSYVKNSEDGGHD